MEQHGLAEFGNDIVFFQFGSRDQTFTDVCDVEGLGDLQFAFASAIGLDGHDFSTGSEFVAFCQRDSIDNGGFFPCVYNIKFLCVTVIIPVEHIIVADGQLCCFCFCDFCGQSRSFRLDFFCAFCVFVTGSCRFCGNCHCAENRSKCNHHFEHFHDSFTSK